MFRRVGAEVAAAAACVGKACARHVRVRPKEEEPTEIKKRDKSAAKCACNVLRARLSAAAHTRTRFLTAPPHSTP